jgi:hypothetical protein
LRNLRNVRPRERIFAVAGSTRVGSPAESVFVKPKHLLIFVISLLALQNAQAGVDRKILLQDMAAFDRAYVPALAVTGEHKLKAARKAMARLNGEWKTFRNRYQGSLGSDKAWQEGFMQIDAHVRRANAVVANGDTLNQAHQALEEVRVILMNLRRHDGMQYFPDALTAYHEPMEAIVLAARGKTARTLGEAELARLSRTLPEARRLWQEAVKTPMDAGVFRFKPAWTQAVQAAIQQESEALQMLEKALASHDRAQIVPAVAAIKPPFARLYGLFGDFTGLED